MTSAATTTPTPLDRCPVCRYSLQGLPTVHRCPECGLEYDEHSRIFVGFGASKGAWFASQLLLVMVPQSIRGMLNQSTSIWGKTWNLLMIAAAVGVAIIGWRMRLFPPYLFIGPRGMVCRTLWIARVVRIPWEQLLKIDVVRDRTPKRGKRNSRDAQAKVVLVVSGDAKSQTKFAFYTGLSEAASIRRAVQMGRKRYA